MKIFNYYVIEASHPAFIKTKKIKHLNWTSYDTVVGKAIRKIIDPFLIELIHFSSIALDKNNILKIKIYDIDDDYCMVISNLEFKSWESVESWLNAKWKRA